MRIIGKFCEKFRIELWVLLRLKSTRSSFPAWIRGEALHVKVKYICLTHFFNPILLVCLC